MNTNHQPWGTRTEQVMLPKYDAGLDRELDAWGLIERLIAIFVVALLSIGGIALWG
jgi:hypothetical protein